jgi:hypothetical protein
MHPNHVSGFLWVCVSKIHQVVMVSHKYNGIIVNEILELSTKSQQFHLLSRVH